MPLGSGANVFPPFDHVQSVAAGYGAAAIVGIIVLVLALDVIAIGIRHFRSGLLWQDTPVLRRHYTLLWAALAVVPLEILVGGFIRAATLPGVLTYVLLTLVAYEAARRVLWRV